MKEKIGKTTILLKGYSKEIVIALILAVMVYS